MHHRTSMLVPWALVPSRTLVSYARSLRRLWRTPHVGFQGGLAHLAGAADGVLLEPVIVLDPHLRQERPHGALHAPHALRRCLLPSRLLGGESTRHTATSERLVGAVWAAQPCLSRTPLHCAAVLAILPSSFLAEAGQGVRPAPELPSPLSLSLVDETSVCLGGMDARRAAWG